MNTDMLLTEIKHTYRYRKDLVQQMTATTNRVTAMCRRLARSELGPEAKQKSVNTLAQRYYKDLYNTYIANYGGEGAIPGLSTNSHVPPFLLGSSFGFFQALQPIIPIRKQREKELEKLAEQLPVYPWIKECRGVSSLSLAAIAGEAGDLLNYPNPAKLWKRFSLDVMGNGQASKRIKGEKAVEVGFNPQRRSVMYVIGDNLIRAKNPYYYELYLDRKEYEIAHEAQYPHKRAHRYMEKRFLRDLWRAWRYASREEDINSRGNGSVFEYRTQQGVQLDKAA